MSTITAMKSRAQHNKISLHQVSHLRCFKRGLCQEESEKPHILSASAQLDEDGSVLESVPFAEWLYVMFQEPFNTYALRRGRYVASYNFIIMVLKRNVTTAKFCSLDAAKVKQTFTLEA